MEKRPPPAFDFRRVHTFAELWDIIRDWNEAGLPVVLDIETTGLDRFTDSLISFQLCQAGGATAYYAEKELVHALKHLTTPLVLHNFKFDVGFLRQQCGLDLSRQSVAVREEDTGRTTIRDTMLMHHLLDENAAHSLDGIVQEHWGDDYKARFWAAHKSFQEASPEAALDYACRDVVYTGLLYGHLGSALELSGVPRTLVDHVHRLAMALFESEMCGVRVDLDYLTVIGNQLKTRIDTAIPKLQSLVPLEIEAVEYDSWLKEMAKRKTPKGKAGVKRPSFNWNSNTHLKMLVYGELGLPVQYNWDRKKRQRVATLDDDALVELSELHPMLAELRDFRDADKVYGTFILGTLERHRGGRIFPTFNVNGTVNGRISSSDPNLQNLPTAGGVRGIYVPDVGEKFISCDYAMLEVVVAAHYSQDPSLLKIIREGASKHDITAEALGVPRSLAKTVNFAMQYLCKPAKVASILGCSKADGQHAWNKYWEAYGGEKKVVDECAGRVDRGEPIVSIFGRRRRFPTVFSSQGNKEACYRQAYSSLIAGTGADITHTAYYSLSDDLERCGHGRAVLQVHDEILTSAKAAHVDEVKSLLMETMLQAGKVLNVLLGVDCSDPLDRWQKG